MAKVLNQLHYSISGDGHPLVLLHGFLSSKSMWKYVDLSMFKCIAIDLPGHGESNGEFSTYSIQHTASLITDLLLSIGVEEYHLVGHSLGGYVGLELKKKDSNCKKVVLMNSTFWADDESKKKDRKRVAKIVEKNSRLFILEAIPNLFNDPDKYDSIIRKLIEEAFEISGEALAKTSLAMRDRVDNECVVKNNPHSFLVIQGEMDPIIPSEKMRTALSRLSVQICHVEGCAHMSHIEGSKFVSKQMLEFFMGSSFNFHYH